MILSLLTSLLISNSLTISPVGLTLHGIKPGPEAASLMKNKVTSNGQVALHPEFNIMLKTDKWQYSAFFLKDCFDNPAGGLVLGPKMDLGKYVTIGAIGGLYIRQNPVTSSTTYKGRTDVKIQDIPLAKSIGHTQIAPMAAATISFEVPITDKLSIETNAAINVFINHVTTGLKVRF